LQPFRSALSRHIRRICGCGLTIHIKTMSNAPAAGAPTSDPIIRSALTMSHANEGALGKIGNLAAEAALSRISDGKAAECQRLFPRRRETGIAQDCVVELAGLELPEDIR
jgi:hypothetical protein